jgi:hypothetical protein
MHGRGVTLKPRPDRNALEQTELGENPQAALHGLLSKVRDLGMLLISVNRAGPGQGDAAQPTASDVNVSPIP